MNGCRHHPLAHSHIVLRQANAYYRLLSVFAHVGPLDYIALPRESIYALSTSACFRRLLVAVVICCGYVRLAAQDTDSLAFEELYAPAPSGVTEFIAPAPMREVYILRNFIRNDLPRLPACLAEPTEDSVVRRDLQKVDYIYYKALVLSNFQTPRALLIATLSCLTHKEIPLSFGLNIPLTLESDSMHQRRYANLPKSLFDDTPRSGDADKLQHFFGSAVLTLGLDNQWLADFIGRLLETGEGALIHTDENDPRDVRANRLGQAFARLLDDYPQLLPSAAFRYWNSQHHYPRDD